VAGAFTLLFLLANSVPNLNKIQIPVFVAFYRGSSPTFAAAVNLSASCSQSIP
jgi:hypothetical protein